MRLSLNKLTVFKGFLNFLHKFQQIFGIIIVSIRGMSTSIIQI